MIIIPFNNNSRTFHSSSRSDPSSTPWPALINGLAQTLNHTEWAGDNLPVIRLFSRSNNLITPQISSCLRPPQPISFRSIAFCFLIFHVLTGWLSIASPRFGSDITPIAHHRHCVIQNHQSHSSNGPRPHRAPCGDSVTRANLVPII